ncbi:WG repeat-containing protein [Crocosphaera watsonii]|uniref:WG repeat-containing protein n=1 Tax=Crocosphaera watsonii TaxID=263511 RepID=UPI0039C93A96
MDKYGNIVIQPNFDKIKRFSDDLAIILVNDKYGYIDKKEKILIEAKFDDARNFSDGLAVIS